MIKLAMLFLFLLSIITCIAQTKQELEKIYINETIYKIGGKYMKGSERLNFAALEGEFSKSELGKELYQRARNYRNTGRVFNLVSLGASVATISFATRGDKDKTIGAFVVQFASTLLAGYHNRRSVEETDKALWQRNRDVLFQ